MTVTRIAEVPFTLLSVIDAKRDQRGQLILDWPHRRYQNQKGLQLHRYGEGPFIRLVLSELPDSPGVYAVGSPTVILYVGRARDRISIRWGPTGYAAIHPRNCYQGGQSTNCRVNALIRDALTARTPLWLFGYEAPSPDALESRLISVMQPPWNITGRSAG